VDCRRHPLGPQKTEEIMKHLHTQQITEFIEQGRRNWKEHVGRMSADTIPKKILTYQPKEKED
jgi:hypothetical protein